MKLMIIIAAVLFVVGSAGFYYLDGIQNFHVEKSNENPIPTEKGFDIPINVYVANPSRLSIIIPSIEYSGVLESSGETITNGLISNIKISSRGSTWINSTASVTWTKTAATTQQLLLQDHVWVDINLKINLFGIYTFPYTTRIDIKDALQRGGSNIPPSAIVNPLGQNGTNPPLPPSQNQSSHDNNNAPNVNPSGII